MSNGKASCKHVDDKLVISNDYLSFDTFLLGESCGGVKSTCLPIITPSLLRTLTHDQRAKTP